MLPLPKSLRSLSPKRINYLARRSRQKLLYSFEDTIRSFSYNSKSVPVVNKKEIRVLGLRRSGNHAIINWIGNQVDNNSIFINHVRPLENPYRNQYESQLRAGKLTVHKEDWKHKDIDWWKKHREGNFSYKDCLIYSYEDQELEKIAHPSFERKRCVYLGKSEETFDVIVMRDPFNLFASRLKTKPRENGPNFDMLEVYSRHYSLPELWISYAKECLGETSHLKNKKIFINYNKWFVDVKYRQEISDQLGISFSDDGLNDVSPAGRGSSFDGAKYAGEAYKMDVLNRWQSFIDNQAYCKLLSVENLIEYSHKIFGSIPGTDKLAI